MAQHPGPHPLPAPLIHFLPPSAHALHSTSTLSTGLLCPVLVVAAADVVAVAAVVVAAAPAATGSGSHTRVCKHGRVWVKAAACARTAW